MAGVLVGETGKSQLDPAVTARYNALGYPTDLILAEYVWVDAVGECRSKTRTLPAAKVRLGWLVSCFCARRNVQLH
jgi:glutamine synthetase